MTTNQQFAPAFSPPATISPRGTWYDEADKVYRFFGYLIAPLVPQARTQAKVYPRRVIIHYYPQDSTLEVMECKTTAVAGTGRMLALRRPSRSPFSAFRVGADVMVNGTRIHLYDADDFTRTCLPGLQPPEPAPAIDTSFSITPRARPEAPEPSCGNFSNYDGSGPEHEWSQSWDRDTNGSRGYLGDFAGDSIMSQEPPATLRMFLRWDDSARVSGSVHLYILTYFLEDGTMEMRELADSTGG
ncbi:unnamed protein product, partial [Sphacelaria rigidula]